MSMPAPPGVPSILSIMDATNTMNHGIVFDRDLVRRYDLNGPRYTSYPTAAQFDESFGPDDYRRALAHANEDPIPRSLSLYAHIPFCSNPCFYCGCTKVITRDRQRAAHYVERLEREVGMVSELVAGDRLVKQLHFGGGTPTFLAPDQLDGILEFLAGRYSFSAGLECAIEIDPRTVTPDQVRELARSGFNRMSLGVQDFDPAVQKAVNRVQPESDTLAVLEAARAACPQGINVDLIYGLPHQSVQSFSRTLDTLVSARPTRIATYSYAHMPAMFKPQTQIKERDLPNPEEKLAILELTIEKLTGAGYVYIGMDHFALPDDELVRALHEGRLHRNFQGYSTQADCDTVGFGMSAIGNVGGTYVQNHKEILRYQAAVDRGELPVWRGYVPSRDDLIRRYAIRELMCRGELDFETLAERFDISGPEYFAPELYRLRQLEDDGLVSRSAAGIHVTPVGRLLVRAVAMVFDAYLSAGRRPAASFSKVV